MKTSNYITATLLLISALITSCEKDLNRIEGEGIVSTKSIAVSGITGIELATACNVVISQGTTQEVKATGHLNIIDRLKTSVNENTWKIDLEKGTYTNYELTIYITLPNIENVNLSGAGDIIINDFKNQGNLSLDISGAGNIDLYSFESSGNLSLNISGYGNVTGKGEESNFKKSDIKFRGAGDYFGSLIQTDECFINIPGTGSCYVSVTDILDITIKGSGSVYYKGNPTIKQDINAAGKIIDNN